MADITQNLWQDLRFGLRQLRRAPGFTLTAVLTLALGIGVNTAIFSLLDQALLRSLPVRDPAQLVVLSNTGGRFWEGDTSMYGGDIGSYFSVPMYRDLRDHAQVFSGLAATAHDDVSVVHGTQAEMSPAEVVSGNYFSMLGVQPAVGRLFTASDDTVPGANPVVVLSAAYWQSHFGGSPSAVGQTIGINHHPFSIIGVAAPGFQSAVWGQIPDLFVPMSMLEQAMPGAGDRLTNHQSRWINIVGRLKPEVSATQAQVSLAPLWYALRAEELKKIGSRSPRFVAGFLTDAHLQVLPGARGLSYSRDNLRVPLMAVMGMAVLVLLIAGVNVASLLLVRSAVRMREFSLRFALGAASGRIFRQLLIEGLLLGMMGGVAGLLLAPLAMHALVKQLANGDSVSAFHTNLDARVLLFSFAITLLGSVCFSLSPAWRLRSFHLASAMKQGSGTASGSALGFRHWIVGLQVGLGVLLLAGAGLFVHTMRNLRQVRLGFNTANLLSFNVSPELAGYTPAQISALSERLLGALAAIPGTTSVGATSSAELSDSNSFSNVTVDGYRAAPDESMDVEIAFITPNYLSTLQAPLLAGRSFNAADDATHPPVVIVNQALLKRFNLGTPLTALGHRIARGGGNKLTYATIVGVVSDIHHLNVRDDAEPTMLTPLKQKSWEADLTFYVRSSIPPMQAFAAMRRNVAEIAPELAVNATRTVEQQAYISLGNERLIASLAVAFAALAAVLAGVGLYGVLAFVTAQRTREIGVRMALGASRWNVSKLVITDVFKMALGGTAVGLASAIPLAHLLRSQLYGVSPVDPLSLLTAVVSLTVVALLAAALPARRAASVNPTEALRTE